MFLMLYSIYRRAQPTARGQNPAREALKSGPSGLSGPSGVDFFQKTKKTVT